MALHDFHIKSCSASFTLRGLLRLFQYVDQHGPASELHALVIVEHTQIYPVAEDITARIFCPGNAIAWNIDGRTEG